MNKKNFLVVHTPGSFGNFIAYLIDCHKAKTILQNPFLQSGASHARPKQGATVSLDIVDTGKWSDVYKNTDKTVVGCVWQQHYFNYILHAYYSRTNSGQFGRCGIEYCEQNFYDFIKKHNATGRMQQDIQDLKTLFGVTITSKNKTVPRHVLRMYFWYKMIEYEKNTVVKENNNIKNYSNIELIDVADIIVYDKLQAFLTKLLGVKLDFKETHTRFLQKNRSLMEYNKSLEILDAVKQGKNIAIENLTTMGEAMILFYLETHYFDIPFFNTVDFFRNTEQIVSYVKHFPNSLRQPNKLFCKHYKRFSPNVVS